MKSSAPATVRTLVGYIEALCARAEGARRGSNGGRGYALTSYPAPRRRRRRSLRPAPASQQPLSAVLRAPSSSSCTAAPLSSSAFSCLPRLLPGAEDRSVGSSDGARSPARAAAAVRSCATPASRLLTFAPLGWHIALARSLPEHREAAGSGSPRRFVFTGCDPSGAGPAGTARPPRRPELRAGA